MAKTYYPTIGLEVHAELKTATKMFCSSKNDSEEKRPNVNICPVCMGHPGTLPTVNKEAVRHVVNIGLSVGGTIADYSEFDRKNYFYPDIPKGYQISQYAYPLVMGGNLAGVALTRVHLEEDTAKSTHHTEGEHEFSLVDFNRAGVPLMELVTEPVIKDAGEAVRFARELQLLLRSLGVADANMEKGEMRVEANVSVSPEAGKFGKKVEVKNLNSFRAVERAIEFELKRQSQVLEDGGAVVQETRGWDEDKGVTFSQRRKEESHDYRYFPDPDIPKLKLGELKDFDINKMREALPELPWQKRERLLKHGIKKEDAEIFVQDTLLGEFFENVTAQLKNDTKLVLLAANYITSDLVGMRSSATDRSGEANRLPVRPEDFAGLIRMTAGGEVSSRGAKDILKVLFDVGGNPRDIAKEKNLFQQSDEKALVEIAKQAIDENPKVVADYRSGKAASLQYLIGQCMKKSRGSGNPTVLRGILEGLLK